MAPSATGTQSLSSKVKRPVPPGIQTNGIHSSTSSPSPSMSASRLPSGAKFPPNSASSNGVGNSNGARSATRRREAPPQLLGRGQRNTSVGLRSASLAGESSMATAAEPQPYIKSDEYILKKYRGSPPSLVIHLHPSHFRFDLQEGHFPYSSPMGKVMLEGLRQRLIPADLAEHFTEQQYYEGCMIVQIYDHKSTAPSQSPDRSSPNPGKTAPFSIHNYNALLTPSSYVPYQTQNAVPAKGKEGTGEDTKPKTTEQRDKENMPAPILPNVSVPRKPKVTTIILRPTPLSNHIELAARAAEGRSLDGRRDSITLSVPPTPTTAVPPTPQAMAPPAKRIKKTKAQLDSNTVYAAEAQIALATTAPLILDPVTNSIEAAALLESLAHPSHSERPPAPKTRKRTVAEMAADEALAAEQERFMLLLDERLSSNVVAQGGANPTGGDGTAMGASFEPRFERFKTIESIKAAQDERKRLDKEKQLENERKLRQEQERNKLETEKRNEQERMRQQQQQQLQAQSQQRQAGLQDARQRQQMTEQAQARAQQAMQGVQNQIQHAHPQTNGMTTNGIPPQPQRFHQQVSQTQNSSPIVRNGTPQSHSSPTVNNMNNVPMQQSNSSMGGSPPRPGSVVHQNHPQMGAPTSHSMTAQRSQQSHAGTPRLPAATPNIQSTPLNRTISQTPRMNQNSPLQAQMPHTPQMSMLPNGQQPMLNAQQAQFEQQRRMQMMRTQAAQQQAAAQGMMHGQPISTQQSVAYQQMLRLQQQQQIQQQQGMPTNISANYQQRMAAMMQAQNGIPQNMNQNFMNANPGMPNMQFTPAQAAQFQHQQQQQQAMRMQAQQAAVAQQMSQHAGQGQPNPNQIAMHYYLQQKQQFLQQNPGGGITEDVDKQLKLRAQQLAQQQMQILAGRRRQQMMAAQQQQGMQNAMNGMQHQM